MGIITRMRKQICVYWPPAGDQSGQADFDAMGNRLWGTPYEMTCRWSFKRENILMDNGVTYQTRAKVFTQYDVRPGGVLYLGRLTAVDQDNPKSNDGAWEVVAFEKIPNFKATEFLRKAFL